MRRAVFALLLAGCGRAAGPADSDDTDPAADTDVDSSIDCGQFSGFHRVGTRWAYHGVDAAQDDTYVLTLTAFDPATGVVEATLAGTSVYGGTDTFDHEGERTYRCDADGLWLLRTSDTFTSASSAGTPIVWDYESPILLVATDPTVPWASHATGMETTYDGSVYAIDQYWSAESLGPAAISVPAGDFQTYDIQFSIGRSPQRDDFVAPDVGLVYQSAAAGGRGYVLSLTAYDP